MWKDVIGKSIVRRRRQLFYQTVAVVTAREYVIMWLLLLLLINVVTNKATTGTRLETMMVKHVCYIIIWHTDKLFADTKNVIAIDSGVWIIKRFKIDVRRRTILLRYVECSNFILFAISNISADLNGLTNNPRVKLRRSDTFKVNCFVSPFYTSYSVHNTFIIVIFELCIYKLRTMLSVWIHSA